MSHRCSVKYTRLARGLYWSAKCYSCRCEAGGMNRDEIVNWAVAHNRWTNRVRAA